MINRLRWENIMKHLYILFCCFMPVTAFAVTTTVNGEYRTECPDGFTKIERTNVKLMDGICMAPYTCSPYVYGAQTCLVSEPDDVCYLYTYYGSWDETLEYTDENGTFEIYDLCPINGSYDREEYGVTKCVNLFNGGDSASVDAQCGFSMTAIGAKTDRARTCGDTDYNFVGICSTKAGTTGDSHAMLTYEAGGTNCWCKMISPAVSDWVFYASYANESTCMSNCSGKCITNKAIGEVAKYSSNWY